MFLLLRAVCNRRVQNTHISKSNYGSLVKNFADNIILKILKFSEILKKHVLNRMPPFQIFFEKQILVRFLIFRLCFQKKTY